MSPSDLLLAALMLSAPVGAVEQVPQPERWSAVQSALHKTAQDWEIMDNREATYILAERKDFQADLDFLRKRRVDLDSAPMLSLAAQLPARGLMDDYIHFNRAYRKHLEIRLLWEHDRAAIIAEALRETDRLYRLWDLMREAKCDYHYVTCRRFALKRLVEALGEDVYMSGRLPPYVPDWSFASAR